MTVFEMKTGKTREEAVCDLEIALKEAKFGVLWHFDLSATLKEKGVQPPAPYTILEVCQPSIAEQVLSADLRAGAFLPCKIAVYEEDGGSAIVMPLPTALMEGLENEDITRTAREAEEKLKACIEQAAK